MRNGHTFVRPVHSCRACVIVMHVCCNEKHIIFSSRLGSSVCVCVDNYYYCCYRVRTHTHACLSDAHLIRRETYLRSQMHVITLACDRQQQHKWSHFDTICCALGSDLPISGCTRVWSGFVGVHAITVIV